MATAPTITAWDLNTNTLLTNLPAIQPTYSVRMNDAGEFSLRLDLTDAQTAKQAAVILALKGTPFKVIDHFAAAFVVSSANKAGFDTASTARFRARCGGRFVTFMTVPPREVVFEMVVSRVSSITRR